MSVPSPQYDQIARTIWEYAEVGYQEKKTSALLQQELKTAGFTVEAGVADIPTAFVATYGSGQPVIGLLAEFDALPGVSQEAVPEPRVRTGSEAGHACGHHLFGTASVAVAAGGTSIGTKGMMVAAKTLTLTGIELFTKPELCTRAKAELDRRRGADFQYEALLGNRKPPLDYRN